MECKILRKLAVPDEKNCIFTSPDFTSWQSLLDANKSSLAGIKNRNISKDKLINIAT